MMCVSFNVVLFSQNKTDSIFIGSKFPYTIFYDETRNYVAVEILGIKYGCIDNLDIVHSSSLIIATSEHGELYKNNNHLFYKNSSLKIKIKLKKVKNNENIDSRRSNIFWINASIKSNELAQKLKLDNYMNFTNVDDDYIFFRDSKSLPKNYIPNYIKRVYEFKERQDSIDNKK